MAEEKTEKTDQEVLDHWASVRDQVADDEELLDWLQGTGIHFDYEDLDESLGRNLRELIYRYHDVDYDRLELARRNLLDQVRKANGL